MCGPKQFMFLCISLLITCVASFENNGTTAADLLKIHNGMKISANTLKKNESHLTKLKTNTKTVTEGDMQLSPEQFSTILHGNNPSEHVEKSSIVARKGVLPPSQGREGVIAPSESDPEIKEIPLAPQRVEKKPEDLIDTTKIPTELSKSEITESSINKATESSINKKTEFSTTVKEVKKIFKPKPTATIGGIVDVVKQPVVSVPTKIPPLGMPTKINYVVPVILTLLILPLFLYFVVFLYRNGKECWEKRHYHKMDFLIDGMYNE